jgi:hypothetical protein
MMGMQENTRELGGYCCCARTTVHACVRSDGGRGSRGGEDCRHPHFHSNRRLRLGAGLVLRGGDGRVGELRRLPDGSGVL